MASSHLQSQNYRVTNRLALQINLYRYPIMLLIAGTIALSALWYIWGGNEAWDDAFISFRYSQNLANGDGLVWNPGGERTQGYSNFLFVLLVAVGIKFGIAPTPWAFSLNIFGLILIVVSFYFLSLLLFHQRQWLSAIPPAALLFAPNTMPLLLSGMEPVFWTGLIYSTAAIVVYYIRSEKDCLLWPLVALSILMCLTRPEAAFFIPVWALLILHEKPHKKYPVFLAGFGLCVIGLIYVVWLYTYFGDIFPNSFYIKMSDPEKLIGAYYVRLFLKFITLQRVFYVGLLGLVLMFIKARRSLVPTLPYAVSITLLVFYTFSTPLVGEEFRFLYPVSCLILFLLSASVVYLFIIVLDLIPSRKFIHWLYLPTALVLAFFMIFEPGFNDALERVQAGRSEEIPLHNLTKTAFLLSEISGIEKATIAYGDAGKVAYYTNATFIDMVGLNENTIARKGEKNGLQWGVDYVLEQTPDLIGLYVYYDGTIFNEGHGPIGNAYNSLFCRDVFQKKYAFIGGFDYYWGVYNAWFARQNSPFFDEFQSAIGSHADIVNLTFKAPCTTEFLGGQTAGTTQRVSLGRRPMLR